MNLSLFYAVASSDRASAESASACTIQELTAGIVAYDGVINNAISSLADEALANEDASQSFPVVSTNECWSACTNFSETCEAWVSFQMPLILNSTPWIQCRLYDTLEAMSAFIDAESDASSVRPMFRDMVVEYGETGTAFGMELDCNDDVVDPICLGVTDAICSESIPHSPLYFNPNCQSDHNCVVGCCSLRTPTLDGIVKPGTSLENAFPQKGCALIETVQSVKYPEECAKECQGDQLCDTSVFETIRSGRSLGPALFSACHIYDCTEEVGVDDRDMISDLYIGPLENRLPGLSKHWSVYINGLTSEMKVMGSNGRYRPENITTSSTTTSMIPTTDAATTTAATTTDVVTTETPCIQVGYDNNAADLQTHWGVFSTEACQAHCKENILCSNFVWVQTDSACYLKMGEGSTFAVTGTTQMLYTGPAFCPGEDVAVERPLYQGVKPNFDTDSIQAYDISVGIWKSNFVECQQLCDLHPICQAWTYVIESQLCYLKVFSRSITSPEQVTLKPANGLITGASYLNEPFYSAKLLEKVAPSECLEAGVNYEGHDLYQFWSPTPIECSYKCREDKQCQYFSYSPAQSICYLKFNINRIPLPLSTGTKLISGSRYCNTLSELPLACQTSIVKPDPHPACGTYRAYCIPDKSEWVELDLGATEQVTAINTWWRKENTEVDMTNTRAWSRMGFAFVAPSNDFATGLCNISDYTPEDESCWELKDQYFPFTMDAEVVAVAPRNEFSGFGFPGASRPPTEWAIFEERNIDLSNPYSHHGFFFDYNKPDHWPVNATTPYNFEMSTVHIAARIHDIPGASPARPTEIYVLFCIWGELQPEIMEEQPDKHTEICAPPLILVPSHENRAEYAAVEGLNLPEETTVDGVHKQSNA